MMPTIRIDDEVMEALSKKVERPFKDTPNDVLRRMLELPERTAPGTAERRTREKGKLLPMSMYRRPILDVLSRREGGRATASTVLKQVGDKVRGVLTPLDLRPIKSGAIRWENRVMWERRNMVVEGLLKDDSPRGVWEISAKGREYLKNDGKVDETAEWRRQRTKRVSQAVIKEKMAIQGDEEPSED